MSVFFPTPLLDYTEKFNRQYSIEQERIQEMQKESLHFLLIIGTSAFPQNLVLVS